MNPAVASAHVTAGLNLVGCAELAPRRDRTRALHALKVGASSGKDDRLPRAVEYLSELRIAEGDKRRRDRDLAFHGSSISSSGPERTKQLLDTLAAEHGCQTVRGHDGISLWTHAEAIHQQPAILALGWLWFRCA